MTPFSGECSLYSDPNRHSQCNLSLASGRSSAAVITHAGQTKTCSGFDDGQCFPTGEVCTSGSASEAIPRGGSTLSLRLTGCHTDSPDVNAAITMRISGCLAQTEHYGESGTISTNGSSISSTGQSSNGTTSSGQTTPVEGASLAANTAVSLANLNSAQTPTPVPSNPSSSDVGSALSASSLPSGPLSQGWSGRRTNWRRRDRFSTASVVYRPISADPTLLPAYHVT